MGSPPHLGPRGESPVGHFGLAHMGTPPWEWTSPCAYMLRRYLLWPGETAAAIKQLCYQWQESEKQAGWKEPQFLVGGKVRRRSQLNTKKWVFAEDSNLVFCKLAGTFASDAHIERYESLIPTNLNLKGGGCEKDKKRRGCCTQVNKSCLVLIWTPKLDR